MDENALVAGEIRDYTILTHTEAVGSATVAQGVDMLRKTPTAGG